MLKKLILLGGLILSFFLNAEENLLKNGDFEHGKDNWSSKNYTNTQLIKPVVDNNIFCGAGNSSVKIDVEAGKEALIWQFGISPLAKVKKYKLSGWIKLKSLAPGWGGGMFVECKKKSVYLNQFGIWTNSKVRFFVVLIRSQAGCFVSRNSCAVKGNPA